MPCVEQSKGRYVAKTRKSPPYQAQECKNKAKVGRDGTMWISLPDKNLKYTWKSFGGAAHKKAIKGDGSGRVSKNGNGKKAASAPPKGIMKVSGSYKNGKKPKTVKTLNFGNGVKKSNGRYDVGERMWVGNGNGNGNGNDDDDYYTGAGLGEEEDIDMYRKKSNGKKSNGKKSNGNGKKSYSGACPKDQYWNPKRGKCRALDGLTVTELRQKLKDKGMTGYSGKNKAALVAMLRKKNGKKPSAKKPSAKKPSAKKPSAKKPSAKKQTPAQARKAAGYTKKKGVTGQVLYYKNEKGGQEECTS